MPQREVEAWTITELTYITGSSQIGHIARKSARGVFFTIMSPPEVKGLNFVPWSSILNLRCVHPQED